MPRLRHLSLADNRMTFTPFNVVCPALGDLLRRPSCKLTYLCLCRCGLTGAVLEHLAAALRENTNLRELRVLHDNAGLNGSDLVRRVLGPAILAHPALERIDAGVSPLPRRSCSEPLASMDKTHG